jgi:hypothetical protein
MTLVVLGVRGSPTAPYRMRGVDALLSTSLFGKSPNFLNRPVAPHAELLEFSFRGVSLIRGGATGNGSELAPACEMSFASREKAILSQWEVGVGMAAYRSA